MTGATAAAAAAAVVGRQMAAATATCCRHRSLSVVSSCQWNRTTRTLWTREGTHPSAWLSGHLRRFSTAPATTATATATATATTATEDDDEGKDESIRRGGTTSAAAAAAAEEAETTEGKQRKLAEVPISEVLNAKHAVRWVEPVIGKDALVKDSVLASIDGGLSGMMVVDPSDGKVVGLTTSRDLLRIMARGFKQGLEPAQVLNQHVGDFMTPISQVIYARPDETIGTCRALMARLGVKCLPILSRQGRVEGLVTARDINDYGLEASERGGKRSYLRHVSDRVGIAGASMADPPDSLKAHVAAEKNPLFVNMAVAELPNPYKTPHGVSSNRRDFGPGEHSTDSDLSEDAHFVTSVSIPAEDGTSHEEVVYMGVADGVGSWREYGVDPREFSHALMAECESTLLERAKRLQGGELGVRMPTQWEVLGEAHQRVLDRRVVGSCTACVGVFDTARHQLHFSNLGDSGIVVLRHIDSDVAGALKHNRQTPRTERKSDLRVLFVSQQQLHSFNLPYQLGYSGEEDSLLKGVGDLCTSSIHIKRGDIIIMATDGLFDNVDLDDIVAMALEWEEESGFLRGGDTLARAQRWEMGNSMTLQSAEALPQLAHALCQKARQNSLDSTTDSPFALLAKENDVMWSGGMPDDCTVICMHIVGRSKDDYIGRDHY